MSEDWRSGVREKVRSLILAAAPGVGEERKWRKPSNPDGVPTFSCDGLLCTLETYQHKIKVTFARGAALDDPVSVFNAGLDGGTRRAVDIAETDALDQAAFTDLVRAAVALNQR